MPYIYIYRMNSVEWKPSYGQRATMERLISHKLSFLYSFNIPVHVWFFFSLLLLLSTHTFVHTFIFAFFNLFIYSFIHFVALMKTGCDTKWVDSRYLTIPYADVTFVFFHSFSKFWIWIWKRGRLSDHQATPNVLKCLEKDKFAQITETLSEVRMWESHKKRMISRYNWVKL